MSGLNKIVKGICSPFICLYTRARAACSNVNTTTSYSQLERITYDSTPEIAGAPDYLLMI